MKHLFVCAVTFAMSASAALAEDAEEDGFSLMERGAQLLMEGLLREMEPTLDGFEELGPQLRDFFAEMGPAMGDLLDRVDDWSMYHPPQVLPNGDIIIRRKAPVEKEQPETTDPVDI